MAFGTSHFALSLGFNILVTVLITVRLLAYRRAHLALLPGDHGKQYLSLTAIIVESAAIYTLFAVCFLVSSAINQVFLAGATIAQVSVTLLFCLTRQSD